MGANCQGLCEGTGTCDRDRHADVEGIEGVDRPRSRSNSPHGCSGSSSNSPYCLVPGRASGPLVWAAVGVKDVGGDAVPSEDDTKGSARGNGQLEAETQSHQVPLSPQDVTGGVLVLPGGTSPATLLDLLAHEPAALLVESADGPLALAALTFQLQPDGSKGATIPIIILGKRFASLPSSGAAKVDADAHRGRVTVRRDRAVTHIPLPRREIELSDADKAALDGSSGVAVQAAAEVVVAIARGRGATKLVDVERVHIEPVGAGLVRHFASVGGRVAVPTTLGKRQEGQPAEWDGETLGAVAVDTRPHGVEEDGSSIVFAGDGGVQPCPAVLDLCIALMGRAPP